MRGMAEGVGSLKKLVWSNRKADRFWVPVNPADTLNDSVGTAERHLTER